MIRNVRRSTHWSLTLALLLAATALARPFIFCAGCEGGSRPAGTTSVATESAPCAPQIGVCIPCRGQPYLIP